MSVVIPEVSGMSQVIMNVEAQDAIPIVSLLDNKIDLSKNQKLRLTHLGCSSLDNSFEVQGEDRSREQYTEQVVDQDLADKLGLPSTGIFSYLGKTILTVLDPIDTVVPLAAVAPQIPAVAFSTDNAQPIYTDLPGRIGGPAMTQENYLTYPGASEDVPGVVESGSSSSI